MQPKLGKTYRTRDGRSARIVAVDRRHATRPVVALVDTGSTDSRIGETEQVVDYAPDGRGAGHKGLDLLPMIHTLEVVEYRPYWLLNEKTIGSLKTFPTERAAADYGRQCTVNNGGRYLGVMVLRGALTYTEDDEV